MIEWFDSLSVYLKPFVVLAIVGVFTLAVYFFATIYERIYLMKCGGRRNALRAAFFAVVTVLAYAAIFGLLCLKR